MEFHVSLVGRTDLSGEIYRQLRQAMLDGRLEVGDRLPPSRELAERLDVSRNTVSVAYDRLMGEGLVTARVGAGTFVSDYATRTPSAEGPPVSPLRPRAVWDDFPIGVVRDLFGGRIDYDFRTGVPDESHFPHHSWRRLVGRELRASRGLGQYGDPAGHAGLREAIVHHIGTSRAVQANADHVTITNGTHQAIDLVAKAFLEPGDKVAVEDPGYPPPSMLFRSFGAEVAGIPVDREGLIVDALPSDARLVYTTPAHQLPLGPPMSLPRRRALLAWAERHDAAIIEDDYDSEFRFGGRPVEPLQTLDTSGRVVYTSSFSKTMLPGLRLGFVVTPPSLTDAVRAAKYVTDWWTAMPTQAAMARFIELGWYARHLRRMRSVFQERHDKITEILARDFADQLDVIPSEVGLHVTALTLDDRHDRLRAVVKRAARAGVAIAKLTRFAVQNRPSAGLVVGYGAIATNNIHDGLRHLRHSFDS